MNEEPSILEIVLFYSGVALYVLYIYKGISPGNLLFIDKKGKSARLNRALFFIEWA